MIFSSSTLFLRCRAGEAKRSQRKNMEDAQWEYWKGLEATEFVRGLELGANIFSALRSKHPHLHLFGRLQPN